MFFNKPRYNLTIRIIDQLLSLQQDHAGRFYYYCECCNCEFIRCCK